MTRFIDPGQYENGEHAWWLGGEAHVGRDSVRGRHANGWRVMAGKLVPLFAGAVIGGLSTFGATVSVNGMSRRSSTERCAETTGERSMAMELERDDRRRGQDDVADSALGAGAVLAAFGLGALAGAVVVLLTTPVSGPSVRQRLRRGAETARHELDEIVAETEQAWKPVGEGAREAIKKTTSRIKEAAQVTKEAMTKDAPPNEARS